MRRPHPQPPAAGPAIGPEQEEATGPAETGAEAKTGPAETAGAAETGIPAPEQPQPPAGAAPPNPPSMITPPEGSEFTGAPNEGAPIDGPIAGAPIEGPIAGVPITDSPIEPAPIADVAPPQLLTNTGT